MAAPFNLVSAADAYSSIDYRTLYTVPAGKQAFIKSVIASNGSQSNGVTLQMIDGGVTPVDLAKPTLAANASSNILAGTLTLSAGESLRQKSNLNLIAFNDQVHTAKGTAYYPDPIIADFVYANGTFVAVGYRSGTDPYNNFVLTSTDGATWTWRDVDTATSTARTLFSVAYGAGLFVAVGSGGFISTSPDGVTWTTRTSAHGAAEISSVIFAGGRFVAAGGNTTANSVQTSTDGITWTARTGAIAPSNSYVQLAYDPTSGLYAMSCGGVGSSSLGIQTSPDGITWTARNAATAQNVYGVAAKAGVFLARTSDSTSLARSTDGINWVALGAVDAVSTTTAHNFKFVNGLFFRVGSEIIAWSSDGITWTPAYYSGVANPIPAHDGTNWYFASRSGQAVIQRAASISLSGSQSANFVASVVEVAA